MNELRKSPKVDYHEAKRLATEVFPKIKETGDVCSRLRLFALREGYAEPTFRRKYYQWRNAVSEGRADNGVFAIVDFRLVRKYLVPENQFFEEVLATYRKRKKFSIAYKEVYDKYVSEGMIPPQGSSAVNLRRYLKRVQELPTSETDSNKCRECNLRLADLMKALDALIEHQSECRNCENLM